MFTERVLYKKNSKKDRMPLLRTSSKVSESMHLRRGKLLRHSFKTLSLACLIVLTGCCPVDPTCKGATAPCPGYFWRPADPIIQCPCDYEIDKDKDLQASLEELQRYDVEIYDLLNTALQNNPSTQQTWAQARAAAFSVEMAKSTLYPTVTLNESLNYTNTQLDDGPLDVVPTSTADTAADDNPSAVNSSLQNQAGPFKARRAQGADTTTVTTSDFNTDITVTNFGSAPGEFSDLVSELSISYLLLDFGGRRATIEAAKQALYNSNWTHNRQVQQVLLLVLDAYYTYSGLTALLEARQSDLKNAQTNYEAASQLFEAGVKTKLDVLQAKSDLINIELNIADIEGQKSIAYGQLANALGLPSNAEFRVPKFPQQLPIDVVNANIHQLIEKAKRSRPDLAAAYALHEQRKEEVVIARSAGLPILGTAVQLQEFNSFNTPDLNSHSVSASLVLSAPLFNGFFYANQERRAKEFLRGACANLREVELAITLDVITSYFNFRTAVQSLKYSDEYLNYSEQTYEAAFIIYREGIGTILDLLTAQRTLANARAQKIQARTQWARSLSAISFAVGTLGTPEEIKPWKPNNRRK